MTTAERAILLNTLVGFQDEGQFLDAFEEHKHQFFSPNGQTYTNEALDLIITASQRQWHAAVEAILDWGTNLDYCLIIWEHGLHEADTPEMVTTFLNHLIGGPDEDWQWLIGIACDRPRHLFEMCVRHAVAHNFHVNMGAIAMDAVALNDGRTDNVKVLVDMGCLDDHDMLTTLMGAVANDRQEIIDLLYTLERAQKAIAMNIMKTHGHGWEYFQQKISTDNTRNALNGAIEVANLTTKTRKL